jgi:hypothetical protein
MVPMVSKKSASSSANTVITMAMVAVAPPENAPSMSTRPSSDRGRAG